MTQLDTVEALSISDFRSLRGKVHVPLDAPIVLIHGANGAGKTSILSALELALTLEIPAMKRDDNGFTKFLVHQGKKEASVSLLLNKGVPAPQGPIKIKDGVINGQAFLDPADARFFSDRCMLAQSALGRLLKIYQDADPTKESALTHFVKDLLKLDQLDSVIDGLHDAGDVRNVRRLAPSYKDAEDLVKRRRQELSQLNNERVEISNRLSDELKLLQNDLDVVLPGRKADAEALESLRDELREMDAGSRLLDERSRLNELAAIEKAWSSISTVNTAQRADLEGLAEIATSEAGTWRETVGAELETTTAALRDFFPDLPSWTSTSPDLAYAAARERLHEELIRLRAQLSTDDEALATRSVLSESIAQDQGRLGIIASQIADISAKSSQLAAALASLLPHIRDDDCPVCGRDFADVSKQPLSAHVQQHIAQLTADAGRLSELSAEQATATTRMASRAQQLERIQATLLSDDTKLVVKRRIAALTEQQVALDRIREAAQRGALLLNQEAVFLNQLGHFRESDRLSNELRSSSSRLSVAFRGQAIKPSEPLGPFLDVLRGEIVERVNVLESIQRGRESATSRCGSILRSRIRRDEVATEIKRIQTDAEELDEAINSANAERARAKELAQIARESRTSTVRTVFNESLNVLWRDLFVRLAPTEPFIPSFHIPTDTTEVTAVLETIHRKGMPGGTPGSMLSSGNLNTAALTLFLALHFSVATSRLPWLILDDPVQSMDELHISQFAALLRTISRNQHRKVIIAVHEKSLFDYLSLELSPAFETDKLLTLEIRRGVEEDTQIVPNYLPYQMDSVAA